MRRILAHEARIHATPGRDLRDLGDALLLHDPADPDPFWNRLEFVRWPAEPIAFERRLEEALVLFATLGRRPHIWAAPAFDAPDDLVRRLVRAGFTDMGAGHVMVLVDPGATARARRPGADVRVRVERTGALERRAAEGAADDIVDVLVDAFGVGPDRRPGVRAETVASLGHPWFTHYVVREDDEPVAVARRATFDGLSYLSSIGTRAAVRGRGFGMLATAAAVEDARVAGSEWISLGVIAGNVPALRLYERLGFAVVGRAAPDLLLLG